MARYRKKPVEIDAILWDGENIQEVMEFMAPTEPVYMEGFSNADDLIGVETLEGRMIASKGDWILRGVKGELYPCKPDIFEATYSSADAEQPKTTESASTVAQIRKVLTALEELGQSWRNSWADFDGRTLRSEMEQATGLIGRALDGDDVMAEAEALVEEFTFNREF